MEDTPSKKECAIPVRSNRSRSISRSKDHAKHTKVYVYLRQLESSMKKSPWSQAPVKRGMRESHRLIPRRVRLIIKIMLFFVIVAVGFISCAAFMNRKNVQRRFDEYASARALMESRVLHFSWLPDTAVSELNDALLISPKNFSFDHEFVYVVHSRVHARGPRDAVRKSWAQDVQGSGIGCVVFILGYNASIQTEVQDEADTYDDIVQYDFIEDYRNLTRKSVAMLRWADGALSTNSTLVKTDDDVSINVHNLQTTLRSLRNTTSEFIAGTLFVNKQPIRDPNNKWFVSKDDYRDETYPSYMSGCLYVIPANVIAPLLQTSKTTKLMPMEDVYITGILGDKLRLLRVDLRGIYSYPDVDPCEMHDLLARHYVPPEGLIEDHRILNSTTRTCRLFRTKPCWCTAT